MDAEDINITTEMIEAVVLAQMYREDAIVALRKVCKAKLSSALMEQLYSKVVAHPKYPEIKTEVINLEKQTLIDDDVDTIMLFYNKLLKQAQFEGKYEAVLRILKEIRQLKAIQNDEMEFKIHIMVDNIKSDTSKNK